MNDLLTTGEDREMPPSQTDLPETDVESQSEVAEEPEMCDSDSEPVQQEVEAESIPVRTGAEHYGLRRRVSPPKRLINAS